MRRVPLLSLPGLCLIARNIPKAMGLWAGGESRACTLAHVSTSFKEIFKNKEHEPERLTEESSHSISFPPSPFLLDKHTISSRCERAMRQTKEIKDRTTLKRSREATTQAQHISSKQAEALYHYLVHRWTTQKIWEQLGMRTNKCMERRGGGKMGRRARRDSLHHLHASVSRMK